MAKTLNLGVAFVIELCMLAAFAYWGFHDYGWAVCIIAPVLAIIIWGLLAAPKASRRLPQPWLAILKLMLFGLAAVALYIAGQKLPALIFIAVAVINLVLANYWHQEKI